MHIQQMVSTHPRPQQSDTSKLIQCIESCYDCTQTCTSCADACLGESDVQMLVRCIRLNLDCASICQTTGEVLSRQTEGDANLTRKQLEACAEACRVCGAECDQHAQHHEHCRVCAEACHQCEQACNRLLEAVTAR